MGAVGSDELAGMILERAIKRAGMTNWDVLRMVKRMIEDGEAPFKIEEREEKTQL